MYIDLIASIGTRRSVLASNLHRLNRLDALRIALERRGIDVLYLKGAAFLDTLYPDLGARPMTDVDVLVRASDLDAAELTLLEEGYEPHIVPRVQGTRSATLDELYCRPYLHSGLLIELHRGICHWAQYDVDYEGMFARAVRLRADERIVPTLSPEDALLGSAVHEAKHFFALGERSSEDVHRIIEVWRPDWDVVVQRAAEWRARVPVFVSLLRARNTKGSAVPAWVLDRLRPRGIRARWLKALFDLNRGCPRFSGVTRPVQLAALPVTLEVAQLGCFLLDYGRLRALDASRRTRRRVAAGALAG